LVRASAAEAVTVLGRVDAGDIRLLTGDNPRVAEAVAKDIDAHASRADLAPEERMYADQVPWRL
jgi:cation transport ATPase